MGLVIAEDYTMKASTRFKWLPDDLYLHHYSHMIDATLCTNRTKFAYDEEAGSLRHGDVLAEWVWSSRSITR